MVDKITRFKDIPQLTRDGNYRVNMPLRDIPERIKNWQEDEWYKLQLNPKFQRGHVWTEEQQTRFMEYLLRGGRANTTIYFNQPSWQSYSTSEYNDFVCVDGLQRLTAVLRFLNNEIKVFGSYYKDFEDKLPFDLDLIFNINNLKTEKEVLQWYVDMNAGGTPHTDAEIEKVRKMIEDLEQPETKEP